VSRLDTQNLATIAGRGVARPAYERDERQVGIVHFGLGAFTRAHQAWYTDEAMASAAKSGQRADWFITGVSMRSPEAGDQLNPQDGLYTLAERSAAGTRLRVIGSVAEVLLASTSRDDIIARLAAPATHVVTFTVTEKGYCRAPDGGLDLSLAQQGFYPLLADALGQRHAAGLHGLTMLSCDNLAENGRQLQRLMREYLAARRPDLLAWVDAACAFPNSMVDRIVPATSETDRAQVAGLLGLRDEGVVLTETFSQWVIEDAFAGPRPAWEVAGAQIVADVAPYEMAKLRMLNGAHSALAYCGLAKGHTFVHETIADPVLRALVQSLMLDEAAPTIDAPPGLDLAGYAEALVSRFENPALNHRLLQIAMDGSQKIPQRWLATLAAHQAAGRTCPAILTGIAGWIRHLRGANGPVDDPQSAALTAAAQLPDVVSIVDTLFGADGLVPSSWTPTHGDCAAIRAELER
jgi:fructuronate reductase